MPPPDLATDAPVLDILQPLPVNLLPVLREKTNQMLAHHGQRFLSFRVTQEPLLAQARLDRDLAPLTEAHVVFVRLHFPEQTPLLQ